MKTLVIDPSAVHVDVCVGVTLSVFVSVVVGDADKVTVCESVSVAV